MRCSRRRQTFALSVACQPQIFLSLFFVVALVPHDLHSQTSSASPIRPIVQSGPGGTISYLEAFPDGNRLLSVDRDDTVGIWLTDGGWEVQHLPVGNDPAYSGAISPDGRIVVSGGSDGRVLRWNVEDERILSDRFHPEKGDSSLLVTKIVFSPDGKYYASIGQGQFDKIWSAIDGELIRKIPASGENCSIAFIANSSTLLIDVGHGTVSAQDIVDGRESFEAQVSTGKISELKVFANRLVVSSGKGEISVWEIKNDGLSLLWRDTENIPGGYLAYDATDRLLIEWSNVSAQIPIIDFDTGEKIRTIQATGVSALRPSTEGGHLFIAKNDQLAVYDINTGLPVRTFTRPEIGEDGVAFSPDDNTIAIGTSRGIDLWRRDLGIRDRSLHTSTPRTVLSFLDSKHIIAYSDSVVSSVPLNGDGMEQIIWQASEPTLEIAPSLDGTQVVSEETRGKFGQVSAWTLWDAKTGNKLFSSHWRSERWPYIALSRDHNLIATSAQNNGHPQCVWRIQQQDPLWCVNGGSSPITFSPDSRSVALVELGGEIKVFKSEDGTPEENHSWYPSTQSGFNHKSHPIQYLTFSQTGAHIEASGFDGLAQVWRTNSPTDHITLPFHSQYVGEATFSSDDRYLIVTAEDGISELWDIRDPRNPEHVISFISFADGGWATITPDGYYRASPGALHSLAFRVGNRAFPFEQFDLRLNRPDIVLVLLC